MMIKVTVFNEYLHETTQAHVRAVYPKGIHTVLSDFLEEEGFKVRVITQHDDSGNLKEDIGITEEILKDTDVIIWWGHCAHKHVPDEIARLVCNEVQCCMGAIFLHSGHHSKPFKYLMGTPCDLKWRDGEKERLWNIKPSHPIMKDVPQYIDLPQEEMYGEQFTIPDPDELLMIGTYTSHEVFRSACLWQRAHGKIFYFQPGHEEYPIYYMPEIRNILKNAVKYVAPTYRLDKCECEHYFGEKL